MVLCCAVVVLYTPFFIYFHRRNAAGREPSTAGHFRAIMAARLIAALAALRAVAAECQALAASFTDWQAAEGLTITEDLRAFFQRPASTSAAVAGLAAQPPELLTVVPPEIMSIILSQLDIRAVACLAATCRLLWCDAPTPPPALPTPGLVETELRRRAEARGLHIDSSLPEGALSWVPYLLKREFYDALRREAALAVGDDHSLFLNKEGRLHLACHREEIKAGGVGEPLLRHDWGSAAGASTVSVPPTLVSSMQDKRIVSVASGYRHYLALSAEGEVYSWGNGSDGALGHADRGAMAGPRRIETLERVENIAAVWITSAAVDDRGRLFTWGRAAWDEEPAGLGYELDPETECQQTPKRVDALSEDRVVGVALRYGFTLAVTDAGTVFSFGSSRFGALGHGLSTSEVLPRRIKALAETGRRFVAVAAGQGHSLALTEEGHVYGWGYGVTNGHGQKQPKPQLVTALAGVRVLLVYAKGYCSCAVTEKRELYTWGYVSLHSFNLGHAVATSQPTPKRVEALSRVKVAAAAICGSHTLVAGEDGVIWGFGERAALGLSEADTPLGDNVVHPTPLSNLRVRTLP